MTTNAAEKTLRSEVHGHVNQNMDAVTASSGSGEAGEDRVNPRSVRPQQAVQEGLQFGPTHPGEGTSSAPSTEALLKSLLDTVQRQTTIIEDQNRRIMDIDRKSVV